MPPQSITVFVPNAASEALTPADLLQKDGSMIRREVRVRLGGGREAISSDPDVRIEHLSGLNLNVRNIAAMELRAGQLSRPRFQRGDLIDLQASLSSHGQAYPMEWKGRFELVD